MPPAGMESGQSSAGEAVLVRVRMQELMVLLLLLLHCLLGMLTHRRHRWRRRAG